MRKKLRISIALINHTIRRSRLILVRINNTIARRIKLMRDRKRIIRIDAQRQQQHHYKDQTSFIEYLLHD